MKHPQTADEIWTITFGSALGFCHIASGHLLHNLLLKKWPIESWWIYVDLLYLLVRWYDEQSDNLIMVNDEDPKRIILRTLTTSIVI